MAFSKEHTGLSHENWKKYYFPINRISIFSKFNTGTIPDDLYTKEWFEICFRKKKHDGEHVFLQGEFSEKAVDYLVDIHGNKNVAKY